MSEREELAAEIRAIRTNWGASNWVAFDGLLARDILASPWLRAHGDRIRAEAWWAALDWAAEECHREARWQFEKRSRLPGDDPDRVASKLEEIIRGERNRAALRVEAATCAEGDDDPHRLARDYLDRLRTTDPSARVLAVIDRLKADMARACEVCDDYGVLDGLDPCPEGCAAALRAAAGTPTHHTTEEDADE